MRAPSSRRSTLGIRKIGRVGLASLAPALGTLVLAGGLGAGGAEAKTPGKTYCYYGKCHRVKTIAETEALVGQDDTVSASHYDSCKRDRHNPCGLTSSGEEFNSETPDNAASPVYPDGTTLLVWSPDTRASIVLRVNNAGPYWGDRKLDVSRKAAEVLGFAAQGVASLKVRVIDAPSVEEATYKKNRKYDPVPGYIGSFASLDEAQGGAATAYMVAGLPSPFGPTTVALGAGNPTQVAGALGTQSGATPPLALIPRTVVAALDVVTADLISPVAAPEAARVIPPVRVAGFVAVAEVAEPTAERVVAKERVASLDDEMPVRAVKRHSHAERTAERNSRSFRKAARQMKQQDIDRSKPVAVAAAQQAPKGKSPVIQDGTNDMSIFSRHRYDGLERVAAQEPQRRRPPVAAASRYAVRDGGDG